MKLLIPSLGYGRSEDQRSGHSAVDFEEAVSIDAVEVSHCGISFRGTAKKSERLKLASKKLLR